MQEMWVQSLGGKDPLEEEMATQSTVLAWRISRTHGAGGGSYSPGVARVRYDLATKPQSHACTSLQLALKQNSESFQTVGKTLFYWA